MSNENVSVDAGLDTGIRCLRFLLERNNIPVPDFASLTEASERKAGDDPPAPANTDDVPTAAVQKVERLAAMAKSAGFEVDVRAPSIAEITQNAGRQWLIPALRNGNFVLVLGATEASETTPSQLQVFDPLSDAPNGTMWIEGAQLERAWLGSAVQIRLKSNAANAQRADTPGPVSSSAAPSRASDSETERLAHRSGMEEGRSKNFGFGWFIKHIAANRKHILDVVYLSLFIHVLSLAPPIFFQVVVDRVLVHHVRETLIVLTIGVMIAIMFNALFDYARDRILLHAANAIDARILPATCSHLLGLPLTYFDRRPLGVLAKHMQQSENIREFLTGSALTTMLNASLLIVVIPFLFYYNTFLATLTLGIVLSIFVALLLMLFPLRTRLYDLYRVEGARQAMLVETLSGISTTKSLGLEQPIGREWDELSAMVIEARYRLRKLQIFVETLLSFMDQALMVAIVFTGALFVIDGTMTVGALIAFQMLAGRVTSPLLQLIGLMHQLQETALSVRMLGEIMNAPEEQEEGAKRTTPDIGGDISYNTVTYAYPGTTAPALNGVSIDIRAGEFVGVVGRSGSGKTTLTRLLLGHLKPNEGSVTISGHNINDIDVGHLRQHVSTVLQETFLFNGTVMSNIVMARPQATLAEVYEAAHLAGAMEFIDKLPNRFDTWLEEGARNLSGGQRQRLGVARALLTKRPILIMDEATSSLDPESEAAIRERLPLIRRGRTLIIISHKLSMLTSADKIVTLESGRCQQIGHHRDLIQQPGIYGHLWRQQASPYQS